MTSEGVLYYWCVNCGCSDKFKYRRKNMQVCKSCGYDTLTPFELEEILEDETLKFQFREVLDESPSVSGS